MSDRMAHYAYDLGGGIKLEAFSTDPSLTEKDLAEALHAKDGTAQLDSPFIQAVRFAGSVERLADLEVHIDPERTYEVPWQLRAFRQAIQADSDSKGRYNGPVAIVDGEVALPLHLIQGEFYDFIATKPGAVPHYLVPELYPEGATVGELMVKWGLQDEDRARYIGFSHIMVTGNGGSVTLVQRAPGMVTAPDCMATSGSTPNPRFEPNFDFPRYCLEHIECEMRDEFGLRPDEISLGKVHLFDDTQQSPFGALEINTARSTRELAERIYGTSQAIKEHPVLYSIPREGLDIVIQRFEMFPSAVIAMRQVLESS